jgi:hypothetical protein
LHLFDAPGRWVGVVHAWQTVSKTDVEGLHRQMGAATREEYERLRPFQARHTADLRARTADAKHNVRVLAGTDATPLQAELAGARVSAADRAALIVRIADTPDPDAAMQALRQRLHDRIAEAQRALEDLG